MKRSIALSGLFLLLCSGLLTAQTTEMMFGDRRAEWLRISEAAKPELRQRTLTPLGLVRSEQDSTAFQGWKMVQDGSIEELYRRSFKAKEEVIVDFGEHITGYFTFRLDTKGDSDAPVRLRLTFAEVPAELNTPFDPYPGSLSRAWLQDEVVTVMSVPAEVTLPRRMSFRYVKIEQLARSNGFDYNISELKAEALTSAHGEPMPLAEETPDMIRRINDVAVTTLRECMQTVYEDGPKRDLRLWIGDLYLESLANMYSFKNHELTKRCLYLLAALADEDGFLHATVFETPKPHPQTNQHCMDYSLLYGVTLLEYLKATGDEATARDLWPVVARQAELAQRHLRDGIYDVDMKPQWWLVFDWQNSLDRRASMQGLMIFSIAQAYELAQMLGVESEVAQWPELLKDMRAAARRTYYDSSAGVVVSGPQRQVSHLSQVWMILSETLSVKEGARALKLTMANPDACYPGAPYAYHYLIEALVKCGMADQARESMIDYWGGMVNKGADTFWEVYDPNDDLKSPYGFAPINSYCHAWSCTPVYFINKYPKIFQTFSAPRK